METIYTRLGDENLRLLVTYFYNEVFKSEIIGSLFARSDKDIVMDKQYCFLSQYLGGPLRYNEKYGSPKMRKRHIPHKIDEAAKVEWLSLMKKAIYKLDIEDSFKESLYQCFPTLADHMQNS